MNLNKLDRRVLGALLRSDNQGEIARTLGVSQGAVVRSLIKLAKDGLVELSRNGQRHDVKLTVISALDRLEEAIRSVLECTLDAAAEAA
jgi:DNA-binding MarR family transcriptional regulator